LTPEIISIIETAPVLAIAILLWRILEREHDERIKTQDKFTETLLAQARTFADMTQGQITANMTSASAIKGLTESINTYAVKQDEHYQKLLDLLAERVANEKAASK
jgi:hypothetical protein